MIDPYSKYPEHIEKKHNYLNFSEQGLDSDTINSAELYELIGDPDSGFFLCKMCGKKKSTTLLFGHYIFYHNLTIQALKVRISQIRINGSSLPELQTESSGEGSSIRDEVCNVCKKPINSDLSLHNIFCQGLLLCKQKDCNQMFDNNIDMDQHLDLEHPSSSCKFGCQDITLKCKEVQDHLQKSHDIIECNFCSIVSGTGNFKNHLRDKHSVNLMAYEKATSKTSSQLYRVEPASSRKGKQVLCNFCDCDLTKQILEISFIGHYQNQHEIDINAILKNLDKNPFVDLGLGKKESKTDKECLKNFTIESSTDESIDDLLKCQLCNKSFKNKSNARIHFQRQHLGKELAKKSAFKCQFQLCDQTFENKEDRKMHQMVCININSIIMQTFFSSSLRFLRSFIRTKKCFLAKHVP